MSFIEGRNFDEARDLKYNSNGFFVKKKGIFPKKRKITVVTPVYNAAAFLSRTVSSVMDQTIQFENIEYILVDDKSTDDSRRLLWEYANQYKNITAVFLEKNTGSPAEPRNLGIELATSDYITFLDADDRLENTGLEALYNILIETGDDYAVGKTMKETSKGNKIVGEHQSVAERRSVSPFSIPSMFQHLAPNARMMRREILMKYNIRFPEMKFAEDKQFFIDVLIHCQKVSTTKQVISYLNRLDENDSSLTTQTDILEKTDTNIAVINYVKKKKLPQEQEKMILNRLYEFDCITRLFNRQHFLKSDNKESYYAKFQEVLDTANDLEYDISANFFHPINKVIYKLFINGEYENLAALIKWNKKEKFKQYIIKDNMPYMIVPFLQNEFHHIREPMLAVFINGAFEDNAYKLKLHVYGDYTEGVDEIVFRNRKDVNKEYTFQFTVDNTALDNLLIPIEDLNNLPSASYEIFIRYGGYRKLSILKKEQVVYDDRLFNFYTTINSNLGLKISKQ